MVSLGIPVCFARQKTDRLLDRARWRAIQNILPIVSRLEAKLSIGIRVIPLPRFSRGDLARLKNLI